MNINLTTVKEWGAAVGAITFIWSAVSGAIVFVAINPFLAWADNRFDAKYVKKDDFAQYQLRASCQYTETQRDQVSRIVGQLSADTPEMVKKDYDKQLSKHQRRFEDWNCEDVLDAPPLLP
ncbi:MAG: hypothetical protein AAF438_06790 [Pseudomonadota bacterium]